MEMVVEGIVLHVCPKSSGVQLGWNLMAVKARAFYSHSFSGPEGGSNAPINWMPTVVEEEEEEPCWPSILCELCVCQSSLCTQVTDVTAQFAQKTQKLKVLLCWCTVNCSLVLCVSVLVIYLGIFSIWAQ